jgi:heterotetrameric sarcosine oxidase gamma subunit
MIPKGLATVIDATVALAPARDVVVLDLWEGELPAIAARTMQVEPRRWWLIDLGDERDAVAAAIAGRGALVPIGGGLTRATISGSGWRDLLSVSGFFDVAHPDFVTGCVASTVIHHVAVRILVTGDAMCEVFFATSYASTLAELWRGASKGG